MVVKQEFFRGVGLGAGLIVGVLAVGIIISAVAPNVGMGCGGCGQRRMYGGTVY